MKHSMAVSLVFGLLLPAMGVCGTSGASTGKRGAVHRAGPGAPIGLADQGANNPSLRLASIDVYGTRATGDGQQCVVGTKVDEDGMNERPVAYVKNRDGSVAWKALLPHHAGTYQGRATHCMAWVGKLFVLVQSDTQSQQSLSQTVLQVVELKMGNGALVAVEDITVPGVRSVYSAWVEKGSSNFLLDRGRLVINGRYVKSSKESPAAFSSEVILPLAAKP